MKKLFCFAAALGFALAGMAPAMAAGAIAVGQPDDVARYGVAIGVATKLSPSAAQNEALRQCRSGSVQQAVRSLCKVVKVFDRQCIAVAMDPRPGTSGFGWAVGNTPEGARGHALYNCRQSGGGGQCQVTGEGCDW